MTCPKCNKGITPGMRFCTSCGTSLTAAPAEQPHQPETYTAQPEQSNYYTPPPAHALPPAHAPQPAYTPQPGYAPQYAPYAAAYPAPPRKRISPLVFVAIAVGVIAIAAAFVFWGTSVVDQASLNPVQRAIASFYEEVEQRIEGSPFYAFVLLNEIYQDGAATLAFDFNYRSGNIWSPDVNGNFTVASDSRRHETAVFGEIRVFGMPFDITAVMNRERIAVQSNVIDRDNFYGITFATFARDITQFGNMIGMSQWDINEIIDVVRIVEASLDFEVAVADDWGDVYADILTSFFTDMEFTTENTELRIGGESVSANRVEFLITENEIIQLMNDLVDAFGNDTVMRNLFESSPMMMDMPSFTQIMRELRDGLREFERLFEGEIRFSLYLSRGDRLMQARMDANMSFDGDFATFGVFIDLGSSVNDTWQITMDWRDDWSQDSFTASWDFHQVGQNYVNSIRFFDGWDFITLESSWNPNSGRFALSYSDGWGSGSFGGSFNVLNDGGFSLQLDRIDLGWGETLDLSMTVSPGADIPRVDFINIDQWDLSLLDLIQRSILGMIW